MPSRKPRLALTVPEELQEALNQLAKAVGKPASTVAVDLLVECIPHIIGSAKMVMMAKAGNSAGVKRQLSHMVGDTAAQMMLASQPELFAKGKRK